MQPHASAVANDAFLEEVVTELARVHSEQCLTLNLSVRANETFTQATAMMGCKRAALIAAVRYDAPEFPFDAGLVSFGLGRPTWMESSITDYLRVYCDLFTYYSPFFLIGRGGVGFAFGESHVGKKARECSSFADLEAVTTPSIEEMMALLNHVNFRTCVLEHDHS